MGVPGGNLYLLAYMGDRALRAARADQTQPYYALQRRHSDGQRWLDVGHFGTRDIAKLTLDAFVVHGQGEKDDFRVKKIAVSQKPA